MMEKRDFYCIVGCGSLGGHLARMLSESGAGVLIIDKDKKAFRKLGLDFGGMTVEGDASDLDFLAELDIRHAKMLVAVTTKDNLNLMVCQIAKELYGVEVIARLYNIERDEVYKEFGIDTICPEELTASVFEKKMFGGSNNEK